MVAETDAGPTLSVVVPFRDEADSLPVLYAELCEVLDGLELESELIFVDDASRDAGAARLRATAVGDARLRLIELESHGGQSAALAEGFRAARGSLVATLDADLQNDPADLPRLLGALDGADCACGVRTPRRDGFTKRLASAIANRVRRRVLGDGVTDIGCAMRVMRAEPLRRVRLFRGAHRFLPVLLELEGARVVELPVAHRPRRFGRSAYGIGGRAVTGLIDLFGVAWMKRRALRVEAKEWTRRH